MKKYILIIVFATILAACSESDNNDIKPEPPIVKEPTEQIIELSTDFGKIYIWLHKNTPQHRANFLALTNSGFYNNTTFHRIIPGFMIQGGDPNSKDADPNNDGTGGPGYTIPAEILDTFDNDRGTLAAARLGNSVNPMKASSGSQFYINVVNNTSLNGEYTVFGKVIKGIEVADEIVVQPRSNPSNRPITDVKMQVKILELTISEIKKEYGFTAPQ
jgi:cyclophilin family peptidyl-prolyl cis-trans isomerase